MAPSFHAWEERVLSGRGELEERGRLLESRGLTVPAGQGLVLGFFEGERLAATGRVRPQAPLALPSLVGPVQPFFVGMVV